MIKSELVQRISSQNPHLYQRDVENIVNAILGEIVAAMARGDRVELRGFGAFSVKNRPARTGRNPRTGAHVSVDKKSVPFFKTGKEMRERLSRPIATRPRSLETHAPQARHGADPGAARGRRSSPSRWRTGRPSWSRSIRSIRRIRHSSVAVPLFALILALVVGGVHGAAASPPGCGRANGGAPRGSPQAQARELAQSSSTASSGSMRPIDRCRPSRCRAATRRGSPSRRPRREWPFSPGIQWLQKARQNRRAPM